MLNIFKNLIRKKESKIVLGRWGRTNDVTKSIYANSDHCGDTICGNPKKVKQLVHNQKKIKVALPVSNKFHTNSTINQKNISNEHFCCMLLGINGPCNNCILYPKGLIKKLP
jgi:hypothetical protein